jgi:hypothetical protein
LRLATQVEYLLALKVPEISSKKFAEFRDLDLNLSQESLSEAIKMVAVDRKGTLSKQRISAIEVSESGVATIHHAAMGNLAKVGNMTVAELRSRIGADKPSPASSVDKDAITQAVKSGSIMDVLRQLDPGVHDLLAMHVADSANNRGLRKAAKKGRQT